MKNWIIEGAFDADERIEIVEDGGKGMIVCEMEPHDGENLDEWGEESIARARLIAAAPALLQALMKIRKDGYAASRQKVPTVLLACVAIAEEAICLAEMGK
jgi:hypothetical protein